MWVYILNIVEGVLNVDIFLENFFFNIGNGIEEYYIKFGILKIKFFIEICIIFDEIGLENLIKYVYLYLCKKFFD